MIVATAHEGPSNSLQYCWAGPGTDWSHTRVAPAGSTIGLRPLNQRGR